MSRKMIAFNDNYADNAPGPDFHSLSFYDMCSEGYKTRFIESRPIRRGVSSTISVGR